jgi:hypothetical protein
MEMNDPKPHARETASAESKNDEPEPWIEKGTSRLRIARSYPNAEQRLNSSTT